MTSKILSLDQAVGSFIKPGMTLHLAGGIGGPSAAVREIIRQFYGKNPQFILIQSTITGHAINILYCKLVKKVIFSACVDIATSSRPSKIMQKIWDEKSIEIENWSLYSLQQRLMAGALGYSFIPTKSIRGSNLAIDNEKSYKEIDDPFFGESKISVIKSLNPDLSVIHGCVADEEGNTILAIPYGDDIWGAFASKQGVLVTVEKIVSSEFIKKFSPLVKIPGYIVRSVSPAPFGLHPFSLADPGLPDFVPYETDIQFLEELHKVSSNQQSLDDWIKEWVLDCKTSEDYINKLGPKKIALLTNIRKVAFDMSQEFVKSRGDLKDVKVSDEDLMLIIASREIMDRILANNYKVVLMGAGSRAIAVLIAYYRLKSQGYIVNLITGNGQYGYEPILSDISTQSIANIYTSKMISDTIVAHGIFVAGKNSSSLSVLGAGQIDKYGNINSTLASDGKFLVGSGGANDSVNAREVIVILNQSKDRFKERLPYITGRGDNVSTVISNMGVFKKLCGKDELVLTGCFPDDNKKSIGEKIKTIQDNCDWEIKVSDDIRELDYPTLEEFELLNWLLVKNVH